MGILSTTFGRVELSGEAADRFHRHMTDDKPNLAAKASLARSQAMLARIDSIRQTKATTGDVKLRVVRAHPSCHNVREVGKS